MTPSSRNRLPKVEPKEKNGKWFLNFSHKGSAKYLCFGAGDGARSVCRSTAHRIIADLQTGNFDSSLDKYRVNRPTFDKVPRVKKEKVWGMIAIWDLWVASLNHSDRTLNNHYRFSRVWLEKHQVTIDSADWMLSLECSSSLWNQRKGYYKACLDWAIGEGLITHNPYAKLKGRKVTKDREKRKPFTDDEIERILSTFSLSKHYKHYFDFVVFLLTTGTRISEAIGLQEKHVNLEKKEIEISSVLARSDSGKSASKSRVRKETKTGNTRYLSIPDSLLPMLSKRVAGNPENLIFLSPKGLAIDDHNFSRRVWKVILEECGVEYRPPYAARHTAASRMIEHGVPITGIAYLLGHTDTSMVSKVYGHMINRPEFPDL